MAVQRAVVFFLCALVLARTAVMRDDCQMIELTSRKLLHENRILYMSDYFPIDYQLAVKYEEILQCQNISSLIKDGISLNDLRYLWGIISENLLQRIWDMLPQRHPSRAYISDLKDIFKLLHIDYTVRNAASIQHPSDHITDIQTRLWTAGDKWTNVTPKNLMDDCLRVLNVLYQEQCQLCVPRTAPEDTLCPDDTVPGQSAAQRMSC
ncbi:hypothetical protein PRIEUP_LOCUS5699 [Pristimantis euphronides]